MKSLDRTGWVVLILLGLFFLDHPLLRLGNRIRKVLLRRMGIKESSRIRWCLGYPGSYGMIAL